MKRLHLAMMLVVLIFVGVFLGNILGDVKGRYAGAALGAALAGALLWRIAPAEYLRQLRIIERQGATLTNPEAFRERFLKGARLPAYILMGCGLGAFVIIMIAL